MPDDDFIDLVSPGGVDEVNHGMTRYRVNNDGRVRVSREAAFWLVRAGFRPVAASQPAPAAAPAENGDGDSPSPRVGPPRPRKGV
jgi:hypothetical protein